jgi:hypothetical protein
MTLGSSGSISTTTDGTRRWRATPDPPVLFARRTMVVSGGVAFFLVSPFCSDDMHGLVIGYRGVDANDDTPRAGPVRHSTKDINSDLCLC